MPGFVKRHHEYECIHTGLGYKAVHRFAKFCSCCCLPLLPAFAYSIHTTWGPPFSRVMQKQVQKRAPFFVFTLLSRPSLHIPPHKSHATKMQQICESGSKAHLQSESPTGLMFSSFQPCYTGHAVQQTTRWSSSSRHCIACCLAWHV